MRITSGKFKSRIIEAPKSIRPTLDNVRKSIFDILGDSVNGAKVLDLFAGSGALGLEALSRGARSVVFVDDNKASIKAITSNLKRLDLSIGCDIFVIRSDFMPAIASFHKRGETFDLIFLDPPYYKALAKKSLSLLDRCDILTPFGAIIAEYSKHDDLPVSSDRFESFRKVRYGDTQLSFYRKK